MNGYQSNERKGNNVQNVSKTGGIEFSDFSRMAKDELILCKMCNQSPMTLPTSAGCGHFFCYYCIAGNIDAVAGEGFSCPVCDFLLKKKNICLHSSSNNNGW